VNEDDAQYRAGGVVVVLSHEETRELRLLFSRLVQACDVACETLGKALPAGSEFRRFRQLTAHMTSAVERINAIVG
jgi:hypothetical protein